MLTGSTPARSQQLLVNGGFEEVNICTEYQKDCAPVAWINAGSEPFDYRESVSFAHEGKRSVGIVTGHTRLPYQRSFIFSQLLCSLRKGKQYKLSFFIKSRHAILDSIGVYFGPIYPLSERKPIYRLAPSLFLADGLNHFSTDTNWQHAELIYTANGSEAYLTIANFSIRDITGNTGLPREQRFMVFVDDISLTPMDPNEELCTNWQQTRQDIYDQHERHRYLSYAAHPAPALQRTTVTVIDTLVLPDILFQTGKADLNAKSFTLLDSLSRRASGKQIDSLVITGHTDNTGAPATNEQLSYNRARAVADYLVPKLGVTPLPVFLYGRGSRFPVADNATTVGRQQNRRVQILLYERE